MVDFQGHPGSILHKSSVIYLGYKKIYNKQYRLYNVLLMKTDACTAQRSATWRKTESIDKDVYTVISTLINNQVSIFSRSSKKNKSQKLSRYSDTLFNFLRNHRLDPVILLNFQVFQLRSLTGEGGGKHTRHLQHRMFFFNTSKRDREKPIYGVPWATLP